VSTHRSGCSAASRFRQHVEVPAQQIDARERKVFGAYHQGHQEIPQYGGNRRNQEKEHHYLAVHSEKLVVSIGLHQVASRRQQFQPDQQGEEPSDEEENVIDTRYSSAMRLWSLVSSHDLIAVLLVQMFSRSAVIAVIAMAIP